MSNMSTMDLQAMLAEAMQLQKRLMEQANLSVEVHRQEHQAQRAQLGDAIAQMQRAAQQLDSTGQRAGTEALQVIREGCGTALERGLVDVLRTLHPKVEHLTTQIDAAARNAGEQSRLLKQAQSTMVWKSMAFVALGGVMLVGGSTAWAWQQKRAADEHRLEAELIQRIRRADLVQCAEGLCANVDTRAARTGDRKQYLPIKAR